MKSIVNGIATEYTDNGGQGTPLVLLHGWMSDLRTFDRLVAALPAGVRMIRLDLPGFGGTEMPPADWSVGEYAAFVASFLAKIGVSSYDLVGHSFGGRVAIKGISAGSLAPRKLILIGAAGISHTDDARNAAYRAVAKIGKAALAVVPSASLKQALREKLYAKAGSDYLGAGRLKGIYLKAIREDLSADAARVRVPTLLIWGSDDDQSPLEDGMKFASIIAGSNLEALEGRGHFVHEEDPVEVARLIKAFI